MKKVILALTLVFLVPVLSFGFDDCNETKCLKCDDHRCRQCKPKYAITKIYARRLCKESCGRYQVKIWDPVLQSYVCDKRSRADCANCLKCVGGKCRQCMNGFSITKIYSRRLCVRTCGGDQEKVWDPVLQSYICDKRRNCSQFDRPSCQECLRSYSCVKCAEGYALKMRNIGHLDIIGQNECDRDCKKCVEPKSGVKVCKRFGVRCHTAEPKKSKKKHTVEHAIDKGEQKASRGQSRLEPSTPTATSGPAFYTEPASGGDKEATTVQAPLGLELTTHGVSIDPTTYVDPDEEHDEEGD